MFKRRPDSRIQNYEERARALAALADDSTLYDTSVETLADLLVLPHSYDGRRVFVRGVQRIYVFHADGLSTGFTYGLACVSSGCPGRWLGERQI